MCTSSGFHWQLDCHDLERAVPLVGLWRELQDTTGRDNKAREAALGLAIQPHRQRCAVRREEIGAQGEQSGTGIDKDKLCCPSTPRGKVRDKDRAETANACPVRGDPSRCGQIGDREDAEIRSSKAQANNRDRQVRSHIQRTREVMRHFRFVRVEGRQELRGLVS